ncbi:hypothetical protein VDG1235_411 [Verrucomicrobiia bacterium DG1235]|nr:hypothetical protein VDG1235_411 [Verrucomicrobiae bacterium DG1235]
MRGRDRREGGELRVEIEAGVGCEAISKSCPAGLLTKLRSYSQVVYID